MDGSNSNHLCALVQWKNLLFAGDSSEYEWRVIRLKTYMYIIKREKNAYLIKTAEKNGAKITIRKGKHDNFWYKIPINCTATEKII